MTPSEFRALTEPPSNIAPLLVALWYDARGDWERAHELAQAEESKDGAWVHAYLHRKEGDLGNAAYWYRRAGRNVATNLLDDEWSEIVEELFNR